MSGPIPPAQPSLVAFHAAHLFEHEDEIRVTSINPTLYKRAADAHRSVEMLEQLLPAACIEPVGVCHQPEANWAIAHFETESNGTRIIVDRYAHPCERGEVTDRSTRRRKIEIEETDCSSLPEYNVLETDVVVTDDGPADRIGHFVTPGSQFNSYLGRRVVKRTYQRRNRRQGVIRLGPVRKRGNGDVSFDEDQALASVVLYLDRQ